MITFFRNLNHHWKGREQNKNFHVFVPNILSGIIALFVEEEIISFGKIESLKDLHERCVFTPTDKVNRSAVFICKTFYELTLFTELGITNS